MGKCSQGFNCIFKFLTILDCSVMSYDVKWDTVNELYYIADNEVKLDNV